jgi:hypothetical protein
VTAIGIVSQPRLCSGRLAVEMHGVHHIPDVWMLSLVRHKVTLGPRPGVTIFGQDAPHRNDAQAMRANQFAIQ